MLSKHPGKRELVEEAQLTALKNSSNCNSCASLICRQLSSVSVGRGGFVALKEDSPCLSPALIHHQSVKLDAKRWLVLSFFLLAAQRPTRCFLEI